MSTLHNKGRLKPLIDKTWRAFTMIVVLALGISIVVVPLVLLIPLLIRGANPGNTTEHALLWLWITMTVIEMGLAFFIIWAMFRTAFGLWQSVMYPNK
ncbi:MAG TPA: hypothetical protein VH599_21995 [Ktedonobacterales bacterium]|jgi:hypothetical protein